MIVIVKDSKCIDIDLYQRSKIFKLEIGFRHRQQDIMAAVNTDSFEIHDTIYHFHELYENRFEQFDIHLTLMHEESYHYQLNLLFTTHQHRAPNVEPFHQIAHLGNLLRSHHDGKILIGMPGMAHEGVTIAPVLQLLHQLNLLFGFQQYPVDAEPIIAGLVRWVR